VKTFTKHFASPEACQQATGNHAWLTMLSPPIRLPAIVGGGRHHIEFEFVQGRHAMPADLPGIAQHLGAVHTCAHSHALHSARLDRPFPIEDEIGLGEFTGRRVELLKAHYPTTPDPAPLELLVSAVSSHVGAPAAFYKDTNPRNLLITSTGLVTIDFDDLTLAPFGYDLAKLIVTLAMTYGAHDQDTIREALAAYNSELGPLVPAVTFEALMIWAELHHVLTARYVERGHYRQGWHTVRPPLAGGT
jgi:Ser/Thr protein kinase RdoA (MazF antagonist)